MYSNNYNQFKHQNEEDQLALNVDTTKNEELNIQSEPYTISYLLQQLKQARVQYLATKNDSNDNSDNEKNKKKVYRLSPLETAYIITEHCHFCWFDNGDDERLHLSTYDPEAGIYRDGERQLRRFIFAVEPSYKESGATDVIYKLKQIKGGMVPVNPMSNPRYVPVGNGIVDLQQKIILPYGPNWFIKTKIETPLPTAEYGSGRVLKPVPLLRPKEPVFKNPDGTNWTFNNWLGSIACDDEEIITVLWQVLHVVCNTNKALKLHKAIFLLGNATGNNGKGTFQMLVKNLVGYHNFGLKKVAQFEKRFAMESLVNKSVIIGDDNPANIVIQDKSNFNSVITGDEVTVEPKGQPEYPAQIHAVVIQSCNKMPRFEDDTGVYRRLLIVPFNADFNGTVENTAIKDQYLADKKLLQYVLYTALIEKGNFKNYLNATASINALNQYEHTNNSVWTFIDDVFIDASAAPWLQDMKRIPEAYLYGIWVNYAKEYGYRVGNQSDFLEKALTRLNKLFPERQYQRSKVRTLKVDQQIIKDHQQDDLGNVPKKFPDVNQSIIY